MSPQQEYTNLILHRMDNPAVNGESHHVYPRCFGGVDEGNVVIVTNQEHRRAHELLAEIFNTGREHLTMKRASTLMNNGFRWEGKHLSDEHKAKIGKANSGPHKPFSPEAREKMRQSALKRWSRYRGEP